MQSTIEFLSVVKFLRQPCDNMRCDVLLDTTHNYVFMSLWAQATSQPKPFTVLKLFLGLTVSVLLLDSFWTQ